MQDYQGTILKGYKLEDRIGTGGFGAVYRAKQTTIEREVAIKIILPGFANDPDFIRRFESEANLIARLEHPYITPLYDFWRDPEGAYLVMRYLRGGSIRQGLQHGPYELHTASQLLDQISSALDFAHRHDVIHRDIKPGNILLDEDGYAYLADFGIAKDIAQVKDQLTAVDAVVGSLDYISPEQARSEPVTARTDIYSLGVTLFEMITGEHPFKDASAIERLYKHINNPLPEIDGIGNGSQAAINDIIQKATAKDPDYRYQDVLALAADFRGAVGRKISEQEGDIVAQLTMREQEVLAMIANGMRNREIADELVVTVSTVKWHITQLYKKLGVRNRVQAIVRARELNLIVSGDTIEILPDLDSLQPVISLPEPENPYIGLHAFQVSDARNFFGRDDLTKKLIDRMSEDDSLRRFLAIIGPSGSGKSSLVRAGLIASLRRGAVPGSDRWFIVDMIPGTHPLDKLETALIRVAADQAGNLREQLQRDDRGLLRVADIILPADETELVIVVDQFEEVFTLVEDEADRQHFLDILRTAVTDVRSRVRIVITLRADYYDRPLHYPEFGELVRKRMETVMPLSAKGLERAIRGPAERVGVAFDQGLVEQIVSTMNYQAGALPLLQYALTELFDRRDGRLLTNEAYQEIGGAVGALANRAEDIYHTLTPEAQGLAYQMFLRLVTLGEGAEDSRRRAPLAELLSLTDNVDLMEEVIDQFAAYRLLALDHDPQSRRPTVEVAHEAILREWERLRFWLDESREDIRRQRLLAAAAFQYAQAGRDDSYLLRGNRLTEYASWAESIQDKPDAISLTDKERHFLEASLSARRLRASEEEARQQRELQTARQLAETERKRAEEQTAAAQRLRRRALILVGALIVAALLAIVAVLNGNRAAQNADEARQNLALAVSREAEAVANANVAATQEALAQQNADLAATREGQALAGATAVAAEALARTTAEAEAVAERETAEQQARLATSRELSMAADNNLEADPELSILLALKALDSSYTKEAEEALHHGIQNSRVLMTLVGHTDRVRDVVYSPDGSLLASASRDGTVKVWAADSGQLLHTLPYKGIDAHGDILMFDALGEKLSLLADGDNYESVVHNVWEVGSGELLQQQEVLLPLEYWGSALSPDWESVVVGHEGGAVALWDLSTGESVVDFPGHEELVQGIAFNKDGSLLAITSADGQVTIWDVPASLAAGEGQNVTSFAAANEDRLLSAHFSSAGGNLALGFADNDVQLWDLTDLNQPQFILKGHTNWTDRFTFHPDDTMMASGSADSVAKIWDLATGEELFTLAGHKERVNGMDYSPDGSRLATSSSDDTVRVWNVQPHVMGELYSFASLPAFDLELSPDEQKLALGSDSGPATLWDSASGEQLLTLPGDPETAVYRVSYHPDGSTIATAGEDGQVRIWDSESGDLLLAFTAHTEGLSGGAFTGTLDVFYSPDGRRLATAGADGLAKVWDAESGENLLTLAGHAAGLHSLAYSPDGDLIATSSDSGDTSVKVWDAQSGQEIYSFGPNPGRAWGLAFSPDSDLLGAAGQGGFIKVWDLNSGEEVSELIGQSSTIGTVAFTPDGERLITGGESASIWDVAAGKELLNLSPRRSFKIALSHDGRRLYVTDPAIPGVRVYALPLEETITLAQSRVTRPLNTAECRQYLHLEQCPEMEE